MKRLRTIVVLGVAFAVVAAAAVLAGVGSASGVRTGGVAAGPTATSPPSISGAAIEGQTLHGDRGTWTGKGLTYKHEWLRCKASAINDSSSASCTPIGGATGTSYLVTSKDLGFRLRFRVSASDKAGTGQATSEATSVVSTEGGKPASSSQPSISGTATVGQTLTGSRGSWVGDEPITYSYQWLRCDTEGNACKAIQGTNKTSYVLVNADSGKTVRFKVTAKNARGTGDAFSEQTDVVQGGSTPPPTTTTPPPSGNSVAVGSLVAGDRLVVDAVSFSPNPVTSRSEPIRVTIRVKDTKGKLVRGAFVFLRSTPILTSTPTDAQTDSNGTVVYTIQPNSDFPLKNGYSVQFFVKAYRQGDPTLAGVSGTRLVQVATRTP